MDENTRHTMIDNLLCLAVNWSDEDIAAVVRAMTDVLYLRRNQPGLHQAMQAGITARLTPRSSRLT